MHYSFFASTIETFSLLPANSSWTLKADIASLFFAKLLNYMKDNKVNGVL